ncbi:MAG: ATP-binding protein [Firmicutes bacterium]|nr:ATP-binding protein [Bacillota bacterium]
MTVNPFTPTFGEIPLHLAGRDREINDILYVLDGAVSAPSRTAIFVGARGCGKTALLTYLGREAEARGWICVNVGCVKGMREDIFQQTAAAIEELFPQEEEIHITGFSLGQLVSVDWEKDKRYLPNWRTRMTRLLEVLEEHDVGLVITVDEVNPNLEELILLASDYQLFIRESRKVSLLMAGLPAKVSALLNDPNTTFLRRASQYTLDPVADEEVKIAFLRTIEDSGKLIESSALEDAVRSIAGFPYMMQLIGFRSWQLTGSREMIRAEDVQEGIKLAKSDFKERVLKNTVRDLSDVDLEFLEAMLADDGPSRLSDIRDRMGKSEKYAARYRMRLIEFGIIESAGRGKIRFAIPGLREYISAEYITTKE